MKNFLLLTWFFLVVSVCTGQNKITYNFESEVIDSLKSGIKLYEGLRNKSSDSLKLYALVDKKIDVLEIYLLEYSTLPESGLLTVIKTTNRQINVTKSISIPVLFVEDIFAEPIKKDQIRNMPLSGYYIRAIEEKSKFKVTQSSFLF